MKQYKAIIIGLTGIGARRPQETHNLPLYQMRPGSHAAAYYYHPKTDLVAVCDIRQEALDDFKHNWADVWPEMRYYRDYRAMLAQEKPDLVSIATPDNLHADITIQATEQGAKAILCEKPIATTLADADRMIAAAEKHNIPLSIEHTRRWEPSYHNVRELIRSGEMGQLRTITGNLYSRRAMLFRNGTHMVDMFCFFAEAEPQWVFAELEEGFDYFTEYKGDGGRDPATDPAASAYIHFANGVRAFYNGVKVDLPGSQYELVCDGGRIEISDATVTVIRGNERNEWARAPLTQTHYMQTRQLGAVAELVQVLDKGGSLISPAHEARKALAIILGMLESHALGNVRVNL